MSSIIYGLTQAGGRKQLWDELHNGKGYVGLQPWIVMRDFNSVRWQNERSDEITFDSTSTGNFNTCLEDIEMEDLNSTGLWFTWCNRRVGCEHCSSRCDRAVDNSHWNVFTEYEAAVIMPGVSDHYPLAVSILPYRGGSKPFKFFNFWMNHTTFRYTLRLFLFHFFLCKRNLFDKNKSTTQNNKPMAANRYSTLGVGTIYSIEGNSFTYKPHMIHYKKRHSWEDYRGV